jgi:hypothetical protein
MANFTLGFRIQPDDFGEQLENQLGPKAMDRLLLKASSKVALQTRNRIRTNYKAAGINILHPSDGLFASIRHKRIRRRYAEIGFWVGPLSRTKLVRRRFAKDVRMVQFWGAHRHLIEFGHRIVTRSGVDTGRRAAAKPFIGPAMEFATRQIDITVGQDLQQLINQSPAIK